MMPRMTSKTPPCADQDTRTVTRIQRYSSYTLAIFTSLHFSTTSIIPLLTRSVPASESYLLLAREIYQTPLSEPFLVLVPVIAHVGAGIALRLLRRDQNLRRYGGATPSVWAIHHARRAAEARTAATSSSTPGGHPSPSPTTAPHHVWPPLSYISMAGYTFAVLVSAHAFLNRGLPLAVEGDSANIGLAYVGHGFARHGALAWLAYGSLLAAGCGHMVWGCAKWLGVAQAAGWSGGPITGNAELYKRTRRPKRTWLAIHGVAILLGGLWAAGGLGVVANSGLTLGWVGEVYDGLYERVGM